MPPTTSLDHRHDDERLHAPGAGTAARGTARRAGRAPLVAALAALLGVAASCSGGRAGSAADTGRPPDTSAMKDASGAGESSDAGGWVALFDGTDLSRWRGYKGKAAPAAWKADGGVLAFTPTDDKGARGDLVTKDEYGDFEFAYEWKVSPAGNSGVIYRFTEDHDNPWETGPEMQVLDNTRHPDGKNPLTSAGADYALYPPSADVTRPVGEWNEARIVARGPHVEHWLNGRKIVEYEQGGDDWKRRVQASKFKEMPDYGTRMSGRIALQDHGDPVWYRNVRIRPLEGAR